MATNSTVLELLIRARDLASGAINAARDALRGATDAAEGAAQEGQRAAAAQEHQAAASSSLVAGIKNVIAAYLSFDAIQKAVNLADVWQNISSRLRIATRDNVEFLSAQSKLFVVAQQTKTAFEAVSTLYSRTNKQLRELGVSQQQSIDFTRTIAEGLKISGAGAAESAATIRQLSQALASGLLRGDEFNSVMENSPRLAQALADGLGVPIGRLREMAEAGELTTQKVVGGLQSQAQIIHKEYATIQTTVGDAFVQIQNAVLKYIGSTNDATGTTQKLVSAMQGLVEFIPQLASTALTIVELYGIRLTQSFTAAVGGALGLAGAATKLNAAFSLLVSFQLGQLIGDWLNKLEPVRRAGTYVAQAFVLAGEAARFFAEQSRNIFDSTAAETAARRSAQRVKEINAQFDGLREAGEKNNNLYGDLAESSGKLAGNTEALAGANEKLASATGDASKSVKQLSDDLKGASKAAQDVAASQLESIEATYQQRLAIIARTTANETAREQEQSEATIQFFADRLTASEQYATDRKAIIEKSYADQLSIATKSGDDIEEITKSMLNDLASLNAERVRDYQKTINELEALEQKHRDSAKAHAKAANEYRKELAEGLARIEKAGQRETNTSRVDTDYLERQRKLGDAVKAQREGDLELAQKLYKEVAESAEQAATDEQEALKNGTGSLIDRNAYIAQYKIALESAAKIEEEAAKKDLSLAKQAQTATNKARAELVSLRELLGEIQGQVAKGFNIKVTTNAGDVVKQLQAAAETTPPQADFTQQAQGLQQVATAAQNVGKSLPNERFIEIQRTIEENQESMARLSAQIQNGGNRAELESWLQFYRDINQTLQVQLDDLRNIEEWQQRVNKPVQTAPESQQPQLTPQPISIDTTGIDAAKIAVQSLQSALDGLAKPIKLSIDMSAIQEAINAVSSAEAQINRAALAGGRV